MTKISGDAAQFAKTSLDGFCLAHAHSVQRLADGAMRRHRSATPKVALIVGGGSGHFPAFLGYIGDGFADAAVAGDIFASPSTQAIMRTAREADQGLGVILGFGNYAGDVLNFSIAAERLNAEGIKTCLMAVSDDVASAPAARHLERRGIAGDMPVFKMMGAAAEAGKNLEDVLAIGRKANQATFTLGVAFSGCTLPGEKAPLFEVPKGKMAIGLGVHGEHGLDEVDIPEASVLAELLCDRLIAERPSGAGARAAVILNGLGATKYEELFGLWAHISARLAHHGVTCVAPCVGEFITSLDMSGCSLTLTWLDDELETLWRAPVTSAALTRALVEQDAPASLARTTDDPSDVKFARATTEVGQRAGQCMAQAISTIANALSAAEAWLGRVDAQTGDGDHGQGMARGSAAAADAARKASKAGGGAASVLAAAADAWADRAGGTSGALWGAGLHAVSTALNDEAAPKVDVLAQGVMRARDVIMRLGGAKPGDKTLVDALCPLADTLQASVAAGDDAPKAWRAAADAAQLAAEGTRDLLARRGRARTHGEKSLGHPDAGALSLALVGKTIADLLSDAKVD